MKLRTVCLGAAAALAAPVMANAEPVLLYMDPLHTQIQAEWKHFSGAPLTIMFYEFESSVMYDAEEIENSSVEITIPTMALDSGEPSFDDHLKNPDFFEVETWPMASFTSTAIERTGEDTATMTGDLTIKDQTHPVTFDVTLIGDVANPYSQARVVGFTAETTLNRSDWGLGMYADTIDEEVGLTIVTELTDAEPQE